MVLTRSSVEAYQDSRRQNGAVGAGLIGYSTTFIGRNRTNVGAGPEPELYDLLACAHVVRQDPDTTLKAHYHQADQFQVVIQGNGVIGSTHLEKGSLHFTNAGTPYGPIRSGDEGLTYFTLRNSYDPGPKLMPGSRDHLKTMARVHREETAEGGDAQGAILGPFPNGLAAWVYRLAPNQSVDGPDPSEGRGQYWLAMDGDMRIDGATLPVHSCAFVAPDEAPLTAAAGPGGLNVMVVQFPRRDPSI